MFLTEIQGRLHIFKKKIQGKNATIKLMLISMVLHKQQSAMESNQLKGIKLVY